MTSSSVASWARVRSPCIGDLGTRVGEKDIDALDGGATVIQISLEDLWASRECHGGGRTRTGWDGDRSAIHVDLAVADLVEPGTGEDGRAGRCVRWDGEGEVGQGERAAADVRMNDSEGVDGCCVCARVAERYLTASAAMGSTAHDGGSLGTSCGPAGSGCPSSSGLGEISEITSTWVRQTWG